MPSHDRAGALLPTFFVIGANRAGTTSLHDYLGQHPDVFMSPKKEPSYFAPKTPEELAAWPPDEEPVTTLAAYHALFAGWSGEAAVGESSTVYLASRVTPRLIRDAVPDARLVAVLRNPVDRAFSDYCLHRSWGTERLSFADAVSAELDHDGPVDGRRRGYVLSGLYGRSLTNYLDVFDRDRLQVMLYDDLVRDPPGYVRTVFEFVGVDPTFEVDTTARRNASRHPPRVPSFDRLVRAPVVRDAAKRVVPDRAWVRAREWFRRVNSVPPELPDAVRTRLVDLYRDDVMHTERLIDRDLSAWLT